jgi:hypothetical protein
LIDRLVSRRAAWIAGLLLALAPPGLVYTSVLAQGTHCEQTAIGLLLLWLHAEHVKRGLTSLRLAFAVGLVFGFHVTFGAAQILPLVVLFDFARDRKFFLRREFFVRAVGIVIGALPFLRFEVVYHGAAHHNYEFGPLGMITPRSWAESWDKLVRLPFDDFARSFWFERSFGFDGRWIGIAAGVVLVGLYGVALYARRAAVGAWLRALVPWKRGDAGLDPLALVLVLPAVWLVLYALTPLLIGPRDWIIGFRYLLVPQVFLFLTAAVGIDVLCLRAPRGAPSPDARVKRIAVAGLAVWLGACVISTLVRCDFAHASELRRLPGARPEGVARVVIWKHGTDAGPLASFVENVNAKRSSAEQDEIYYELAGLLRMGVLQVERNRAVPDEHRDPRRALREIRDLVPPAFKAWFDVPDDVSPERLAPRRPEFGVVEH